MSVGFQAVQWSWQKLVYDGILLAAVVLYISSFIAVSYWIETPVDLPAAIDVRIRAFGSCAFLMLTIILAIGPLARLDPRFHILLFNRRHFGVLTFVIAALHAWFMIEWYEAKGELPNLSSNSPPGRTTESSSASRSRGSALQPLFCCSCSPPPATISGSPF